MKDKAGDDEHRRHRQHLRDCFRGCPPGRFMHAFLPRPGHDSSLRERADDGHFFYSERPTSAFATKSPHSANIDRRKFEQQYGGILARTQPVCAPVMEF